MKTDLRLLLAALPCLAACAASSHEGSPYAVKDSLGIRIVESLRPSWKGGQEWVVDPEPVFDLSGQEDPDLFRPASPIFLDDGRTVLFNPGNCDVRFYGETGDLITSTGGCGSGPGEFRPGSKLLTWRSDSLVVFDFDLRRLSFLDRRGVVGRTSPVPSSMLMPVPTLKGTFADGTLAWWSMRDPRGRQSPGLQPAELVIGLTKESEDPAEILRAVPGPVYEYYQGSGRLNRRNLAFGGTTEFAFGRHRFFLGFPDEYEIHVMGTRGGLEAIIRRTVQAVPVTRMDVERVMQASLAKAKDEETRRRIRRRFADFQHAPIMPSFGNPVWPGQPVRRPGMVADTNGNLWVMDYYPPGEEANKWSVFSDEGVWLGTVDLPEQFRPTQIGADFVLGLWFDEYDFAHIRRHRLTKPHDR